MNVGSTGSKTLFRFLSIMVMVSTFLPIVFVNLPPFFRSHHVWTILWFLAIILLKFDLIFKKIMLLPLVYGAIVLLLLLETLWVNIDDWMKTQIVREFYEIIVGISIIAYYRASGDFIGLAKLVRITFYCIIITSVLSILTSLINPTYARDIVGVSLYAEGSISEEIYSYRRFGGGGYSFFTALVPMIPIMFYLLRSQNQNIIGKRMTVILIAIFMITPFSVQLFGNILITMILFTFSLVGNKSNIKSIVWFSIVGMIYYSIPINTYSDIMKYFATFFDPGSENYYKFMDLSRYLIYGEVIGSATGGRLERFPMLLASFLSNPLYGGEYWNGHMFWMNKLAVFGLLGTIPFVYIIISHLRMNMKDFNKEFQFYFLLASMGIVGLGFLKNLSGRETWYTFFVLIPGFYYLINPEIKYNKEESGLKS